VSAESAEEVRKHVKVYITVFVALAALTIVTVGISYLHLPPFWAITFALIVATVKGSLVACYFMHLISERAIIYWVLIICFVFFVHLLLLPVATSSH
jgi:cytochrome c oxidase subunit 4